MTRSEKDLRARADRACRELLFLAGIEGIKCLSRGGKGCIFRAVEELRPDIAAEWRADMGEDGSGLLRKHFPELEDEPTEHPLDTVARLRDIPGTRQYMRVLYSVTATIPFASAGSS